VGLVVLLAIIGVVFVLYGAERLVKARAQLRRRRVMSVRLDRAARRAEHQQASREAEAEASVALTSLLPAIQRPPLTVPGAAEPAPGDDEDQDQEYSARPKYSARSKSA
jgi:hypothetical protein